MSSLSFRILCGIAFASALISLVCFYVQQRESSTEELVRDQAESQRDRLLNDIYQNQLTQMQKKGGTNNPQFERTQMVADIYKQLARTGSSGKTSPSDRNALSVKTEKFPKVNGARILSDVVREMYKDLYSEDIRTRRMAAGRLRKVADETADEELELPRFGDDEDEVGDEELAE